jgi:radical SAM protein with 4Fe4S-binding SPASM domain
MTAIPATKTEFDHLVHVRVLEGCDLRCDHCFIPANPKRMRAEDFALIPSRLARVIPKGARVRLQWHGGEPTLLGSAFLSDAIDAIEGDDRGFVLSHGIQTNLMRWDDEWRKLFVERFDGEIGVSWDPGMRKSEALSPEETEGILLRNVEAAVAAGLRVHVTSTLSKPLLAAFPDPSRWFLELGRMGVSGAHLESMTKTGAARAAWERIGLDNAARAKALSRFLRAYALLRGNGSPIPFCSPFDGILSSALALADGKAKGTGCGSGCWSGGCDSRFHTIDADGYRPGCTAITAEDGNPRAGKTILRLLDIAEEREKRTISCLDCEFRPICSSGCLAGDMDDGSGECAGGRALFETAKKIVGHWTKDGNGTTS